MGAASGQPTQMPDMGAMQGALGGSQQSQMLAQQNAGMGMNTQAEMLAQQNADFGLSPTQSIEQVYSSTPGAPESSNISLEPTFQEKMQGADWKNISKELSDINKAQKEKQKEIKPQMGAQAMPSNFAPFNFYANSQGAGQPGMSGAMQAIQQGQMGAKPMGLFGAMQQPKGY